MVQKRKQTKKAYLISQRFSVKTLAVALVFTSHQHVTAVAK